MTQATQMTRSARPPGRRPDRAAGPAVRRGRRTSCGPPSAPCSRTGPAGRRCWPGPRPASRTTPALWQVLAADVGCAGLLIPEGHGGAGAQLPGGGGRRRGGRAGRWPPSRIWAARWSRRPRCWRPATTSCCPGWPSGGVTAALAVPFAAAPGGQARRRPVAASVARRSPATPAGPGPADRDRRRGGRRAARRRAARPGRRRAVRAVRGGRRRARAGRDPGGLAGPDPAAGRPDPRRRARPARRLRPGRRRARSPPR